jgi:K+-transporting ATPase A subunit
MDAAAEILVIIVSVVLSVFLVVSIILGIYLIKLSSEIRKITKTAQNTVSHIDTAVVGISRLASPVYVAELVNRLVKKYTKKGKK